jgi:hypothetical protein
MKYKVGMQFESSDGRKIVIIRISEEYGCVDVEFLNEKINREGKSIIRQYPKKMFNKEIKNWTLVSGHFLN